MKKYLLLLLMLASYGLLVAEGQPNQEEKKKTGFVTSAKTTTSRPQHTPANVDFLLLVGDNGITIRFNGDFGEGTYQLSDTSTDYTVTNTVVATAGSTEFVPFMISETDSYNFYIEFDDGSWSQLSWGSE